MIISHDMASSMGAFLPQLLLLQPAVSAASQEFIPTPKDVTVVQSKTLKPFTLQEGGGAGGAGGSQGAGAAETTTREARHASDSFILKNEVCNRRSSKCCGEMFGIRDEPERSGLYILGRAVSKGGSMNDESLYTRFPSSTDSFH